MSSEAALLSGDPSTSRSAGLWRLLLSSEPWRAVAFLLLSFVLGVFWFVVLVTLLAVGLGLAIVWVGLPILALTMLLWIGGARLERGRIALLYGERIASPYRPLPEGGLLRRARAIVLDPAIWRDLLYLLLLFPIGVVELVIAVVCLSVPLALITVPFYFWTVPGGMALIQDGRERWFLIDSVPESLIASLVGFLLAVPAALIVVAVGRAHLWLARRLLRPSASVKLAERVDELTRSRSVAMEAQLAERQRIERDLHDGAQQRLVALAMDLGLAKEKLRTDPEAGRRLVEASHEEAKRVLAELRDLVRGIHPAVLTDRGLDAAISAIAGRSPVPVTVNVQLDERAPAAVEAAAYFVVVEALTNVAKHSLATAAWVTVRRDGDRLLVNVADDGTGGADAGNGNGSGLAGLADRLTGLDGTLTVYSPAGGPTHVRAVIPCAW